MRRQLEFHVEQNYGSSATIGTRYWLQYLGITSRSDPKLDAISPEMFAAADESPVLLIHGLDDTVVPYDQSTRMEAALRKAGKSVRLETLKAEDHYLSRAETRLQMLTATVDFLKSCNPARRT
jgi:dipeptidyl aminopeptidase/acylaminoacyl peptidase